jgi:hypothetical protein
MYGALGMKQKAWSPVRVGRNWENGALSMGKSELRVNDVYTASILIITMNSVVGLGYEDTFGSYRRTVQHAL